MKKLMCALAVVAAGVAMAEDVTSNVVGYQGIPVFKFGIQGATFTDLGASEANMTLGCLKTNSKGNSEEGWTDGWDPNNDFLYFIDTGSKFSDAYQNVPEWMTQEGGDWEGYEPGWYVFGEEELKNDLPLPFGQGIAVKASSQAKGKNPQLMVAGQVKADQKDIPVYKFTLVPNCLPRVVTLGEIKTNSEGNSEDGWTNGWDPNNDFLYFIDSGSKFSDAYQNVPKWMTEEGGDWEGYDPGWYIFGEEELKNELPINPGDGVAVKASSQAKGKEPTIIFPSALAK